MNVSYEFEKVNFIDDNNIFVGFELTQYCCEQTDTSFVEIHKDGTCTIIDDNDEYIKSLYFVGTDEDLITDYKFNEIFYNEYDDDEFDDVIFQLSDGETDRNIVLALTNIHNGYYFHTYITNISGVEIKNRL